MRAVLAGLLFAGACCSSLPTANVVLPARVDYTPPRATYAVDVTRTLWHDASRNRDVPATIYMPRADAPVPVVIFSHGIGENRDSYAYLGRGLAARGFASVHLTHFGTDSSVPLIRRYASTKKKENWVNRSIDVRFAIDQLARDRRLDLARLAVAGHSAGAFTAIALVSFDRDPHVKAAVAMSMPKMGGAIPPDAYDRIAVPLLNLTGTCDTSLIYRTYPPDRRAPFDQTHAARQYLVTIDGVTHDTFSNRDDPEHPLIVDITAAFLDAYLRGNDRAREWLDRGGLSSRGGLAVERK